ncbi:hypothetical protein [Natranaerobius trueperi]|nr:hypothetical protein [Natranaerobius trueperi]
MGLINFLFNILILAIFISWLKSYLDDIKDQNKKIIRLLEDQYNKEKD